MGDLAPYPVFVVERMSEAMEVDPQEIIEMMIQQEKAIQALGLLCVLLSFAGVWWILVDPMTAVACGVLSLAFNRITG